MNKKLIDSIVSKQVHELNEEKLQEREVVHIDIVNDPLSSADYKENEDPSKYVDIDLLLHDFYIFF